MINRQGACLTVANQPRWISFDKKQGRAWKPDHRHRRGNMEGVSAAISRAQQGPSEGNHWK